MATRSSAFIGLPGDYGTFEEVSSLFAYLLELISLSSGDGSDYLDTTQNVHPQFPLSPSIFFVYLPLIITPNSRNSHQCHLIPHTLPLRSVTNGINAGFVSPANVALLVFVDGPPDHSLHDSFDLGSETIKAIED